MNASTPGRRLTFRLAQSGDFDAVVKLSEGVYDGHDYLPFKFHEWLQRDNLNILLAFFDQKLVGLTACFVVDEGRTFIRRAERILAELRGQGLGRQLREFARKYVREHYPSVQRHRFTILSDLGSSVDQTKLLDISILSYDIEKNFSCGAAISTTNAVEIEMCSKEYFSSVIISSPVREQLFPANVIAVNFCPFEPLRSNIDYMLQESDEIFVEKCSDDASPRSVSFRTFSPREKFQQWQAAFYTKDPVLFEAHLLYQLKRACEVVDGDFIFLVSCLDKSLMPFARKTMEEQLQLKEHDWFMKKTMKLFERDVTRCSDEVS